MKKYPGLECILLVDDDPPTNFIHRKIIQTTDIDTHVQTCENGRDALDYIEGTEPFEDGDKCPKPGIIFLDINMPGMNGWEFLDKYNQLPEEKKENIVVAMLTTSLNPDDQRTANEYAGVHSFFSKPLKKDYLHQLIEERFSSQ